MKKPPGRASKTPPRRKAKPLPQGSSLDLFQKSFYNSPVVHSVVRMSDATIVEVNQSFLKLFGRARADVVGKTPFELNLWVDPQHLVRYREKMEADGFVRNFETEVIAKGGDIRTVLLSSDLVDIDGVPHLLNGGVDITSRKRSERIQQATFHISEAAHAAENLDQLYADIHGIIKGLMPAHNFLIALFDAATGLISFPYFVDERSPRPKPFPLGTGLTGYVLRTGKPLLLDAAINAGKRYVGDQVTYAGCEDLCYVESGVPCATWLGAPLIVEGKSIGVMALQDYENGYAYGEEEKRILAFVATQTALAIDRKRAQQALRESEQKFRALFEGSSQGVVIHDEREILEANPAALRIAGIDNVTDILGKHPKDASPPFQPDGESSDVASRRHIAECMERGSARFDWQCLNAQGQEVPVEVILTRVELDGKRVIQAVMNDISERKRAEAELRASEAKLRESEARFSTAFHACPVLITIARMRDGRYVEVNDAFKRWFGLERGEILSRNSVELGLWAALEQRTRFFAELARTGSLRNVECLLRRANGAVHTFLISADIIQINSEPHVLGFGLDITQSKQVETELQKALANERELSQLKSDFVALVSHEFRTPLEIIMSSADNLQRYHEKLAPEKREQLLRTINKSVRRMAGMMEDVLVLGRLETDRMTFNPAAVDLKALCKRLGDEIEAATGKRCPIHLDVGKLPKLATGDESVLRHIFTNLLSNAVKYSPAGERVDFTVRRDGDDAVCRVVDHGCGIPQADQKRMFEAFYRGANVRQIPGTGLGLLIVQRCVDLHEGEIQFESVEGKGTTFTVRLPLFAKPS